jgi:hypothetical protein
MCGVSRQGAWPTPGSRSQNHMLSPDARHWGHGIGSSEAGSPEGSTLSPAPLGRLFYGLAPVNLLQKCNPNLPQGAISQPLFCINTSSPLPPPTPPHPLIPCPFVRCLWQSCASVLSLHPRNPSRKMLPTKMLSHSQQHHGRIC